ncbi:MAG TPA: ATP-binding protein [Steroidobacteraceae bacterium]|nr:ATP-binding protein [Steroidobacteraceae bacterium]
MRSIHDDGLGSEPSTASERALALARAQYAAVAQKNDALEVVLAIARLGYCRIDAGTRAVAANSQFKAEFGLPPDAVPSWPQILDRVGTEQRAAFSEAIERALREGNDLEWRLQTLWPDGTSQWISLRGRLLSDGAEGGALFVISRNVTVEIATAASEQLRHTQSVEHEQRLRMDAEAANRGKDQFLSMFSHELRSPLNAILGWNRILSLKRAEDPEVASITARIDHSARAQLKMVNDLLDLGRIETGKLRIELRPMRLAQVAAAALDLARPVAAAKSITITSDFEPGGGALRGDPDRLQQVVSNLLSNALKFTPSGGRISLLLRNRNGFAELTVRDTGQGIDPDLLPHVFDRFRQGDSSSTRHAGGLGLGLALVREIVTLHGGSVSAMSAGPGAGAAFTIRFPARPVWRAAETAAPGATELSRYGDSLRGLSILVVDDESDARAVVAETLRLEGARVTVTDSAGSAYAKVREPDAHFDIIVTDIAMPEEDGYSLVRRLRALQTGRQMLAIAVTGYASKSDVAAALDAGFDLHVAKPVDLDAFVPMLRRLANGGR